MLRLSAQSKTFFLFGELGITFLNISETWQWRTRQNKYIGSIWYCTSYVLYKDFYDSETVRMIVIKKKYQNVR